MSVLQTVKARLRELAPAEKRSQEAGFTQHSLRLFFACLCMVTVDERSISRPRTDCTLLGVPSFPRF